MTKLNMIAVLALATAASGESVRAESQDGTSGNNTSSQGSILVRNEGGYNARFSVQYDPSDGKKRETKKSGDFSIGAQKSIAIPAGATNIHLKVEENTGTQWSTVFTREYSDPEVKCYKVYGTTLQPKHKSIDCP